MCGKLTYLFLAILFFTLSIHSYKDPISLSRFISNRKYPKLDFRFNKEVKITHLIIIGLIPGLLLSILTSNFFWVVIFILLSYAGHHYLKRNRQKNRIKEIRKNMLSAIQLLWIPCNAGLSFKESVKIINTQTNNIVIQEIDRCYSEISAGKRKEVSYRDLAKRTIPEVESLFRAISYTEGMGKPISDFLKREIEKTQNEKRAKIQEIGDKISSRVLYITIGIMGPVFIIILFGPMVDKFQIFTNMF